MRNIFDEIGQHKPNEETLVECQRVIEKFEKSLTTKTYLKDTVENISQEVKRLSIKVEHEMAEKIREIETLKEEVDNGKAGNRELVTKIKNCHREIISLSTENYELKEQLESSIQVPESSKQELEKVNESLFEKIKSFEQICSSMKIENESLRLVIETNIKENGRLLSGAFETLRVLSDVLPEQNENFVHTLEKVCDINGSQINPEQSIVEVQNETNERSSLLADDTEKDSRCSRETLGASLTLLKNHCSDLRKGNQDLKAGLTTFMKLTSNSLMPEIHSSVTQLLKTIEESVKHETACENNISESLINIAVIFGDIIHSSKSLRSTVEAMAIDFAEKFQTFMCEIEVCNVASPR